MTGTPAGQRWHFEGVHTLKAGVNTFRLESEPLMSHIDKLRLLQVGDDSPLAKLINDDRLHWQPRSKSLSAESHRHYR